ncbi:hypothetical protein IC608_02180 [Devosia sp. PTR5]|uniref:CsgH-like domain-containing protein n=1 Tax=Devosia oryzisoli TaxID=2774138 RepID=A0A927FTA3_9HYPH|nr:curli-like amyloid fiber formation chaperone CsgH [Devosia oryzisoli]MBD8064284.1 hypothetical protein [Devosia oryzisoli]
MLPYSLPIALAGLGLGLAGFAATANAAPDGLSCGVMAHTANGMATLEGVIKTDKAAAGSYSFALKSSGGGSNNSVRQGGQFRAEPGMVTTLGQVSINSDARTSIEFTVTIDGRSYDCSAPWTTRT